MIYWISIYDLEIKDQMFYFLQLFRRFNTQTLPFSFILPADFSIDREVIKLRSEDQLRADSYDKFPWTSEEFGSFLTDRTSVNVGRVIF